MSRLVKITGMLDPHTHLRDLDWAHKATFSSETATAVAGGYWAVFDMPNTPPSTVSRDALDRKLTAIQSGAICDWGVYFGASQADNTDVYHQILRDVCGLKMFCNATTGDLLIPDQQGRDRHFAAWPDARIIAVHAEAETVAEILELVRKHRKRTHFLHISTRQEIDCLRAAKAEGLPVTIGVCPHHLFLTENDLSALGTFGLMKPNLKTAADRDALREAVASGVVDVIESDHAPHTLAEKQSQNPPYGVPGLETNLPLTLQLVHEGCITLERAIDLLAIHPRHIWGVECPPDTYALVDLDAEYIIETSHLHSQCGWTPFEGMRVRGKVVETWIRGRKVFDGERVLVAPGFGRNLFGDGS
jgi:carbamoyl-phosphate synthase/aspartate carbamoyltransferase/dihydroorotase